MDAGSLIDDLRRRGLSLVIDESQLLVRPGSLLTPEDVEAIRANKPALVALLTQDVRPRLIVPMRPDCLTCGAPLRTGSRLRCPNCVAKAYQDRDERWSREADSP